MIRILLIAYFLLFLITGVLCICKIEFKLLSIIVFANV